MTRQSRKRYVEQPRWRNGRLLPAGRARRWQPPPHTWKRYTFRGFDQFGAPITEIVSKLPIGTMVRGHRVKFRVRVRSIRLDGITVLDIA